MARDFRVRWALEEVGQPYVMRFVPFSDLKKPSHLRLHPFGKIPVYQEDALVLFETGAIVLHIARARAGLLPDDHAGRERAIMWMFAALSTIEPPILERETILYVEQDKPWSKDRMPIVEERVRDRLRELSDRLGEAEWLEGGFGAGDLMTIDVLRRLEGSGLLEVSPNVAAFVARGKSRPAFRRALASQRADYLEQQVRP
ncbi:MAG TPA: glutathione S-transferase family protein [Sphingomicrobium sp.]|nr:glutathione S-transferase family protein [Sphingomicrobium sp.]